MIENPHQKYEVRLENLHAQVHVYTCSYNIPNYCYTYNIHVHVHILIVYMYIIMHLYLQ